jgi:putative membrane protein insertion efficiency factor
VDARDDGVRAMDAGPGWPTRAALALVAGYQRWLSPLLPGACRFWPTCSEYARLALLRHGLVRGGGLALWRFCRCHPFARGGIDPPP